MKDKNIKFNAICNGIRQAASVLFPLITFPYATRVLGANNYGTVGWCSSVVSYFILFAELGFGSYATREGSAIRDNRERLNGFASQVFSINLLSTLISCALFTALLLTGKLERDTKLILLIQGINIFMTTFGVDWVFYIHEDFLYITVRSIVVHLMAVVSIFLFVRDSDGYIIYAAIFAFATALGYLSNWLYSKKYVNIRLTLHTDFRKHILPILVLFANSVMITIYLNSDVTMLGIMKDDTAVGIYKVSVQIYLAIKGFIMAMSSVLIPRVAYYVLNGDKENYTILLQKTTKAFMTIMLPASIGLFMISKNAVAIAGGAEYISGVTSMKILSIALIPLTFSSIFANLVLVANRREKKVLRATIVSAALNIFLNLFFIPFWSMNGAAITTLISEFTVAVLSIYYAKDLFHFHGFSNTVKSVLLGCAGIIICCILVSMARFNLATDTILKILFSATAYMIIEIICKNDFVFALITSIKKKSLTLKKLRRP